MEYLNIGCSPNEEPCAQVGQPDYYERARIECTALRNQLKRMFGPVPEGARIVIKSFPHDFGTYYELVCYYEEAEYHEDDVDIETRTTPSEEYAFKLEDNIPDYWDEEAKKELKEKLKVN